MEKNRMSWIAAILRGIYIFLLAIVSGFRRFIQSCGTFSRSFIAYFYNDWLTNFPSNTIRCLYLRGILGVKIGKATFIHMGCRFEGDIRIGSHSVLGRKCILKGEITIGDNVSITAETYVFTSSHYVNSPDFSCFYRPVVIDDYAWIGARAMIMPGVHIGKGAVLAAAAVATKDIPEYLIFAGIPAKEVGVRSRDLNYEHNYFPFFQ